jgi:hypothetical protein
MSGLLLKELPRLVLSALIIAFFGYALVVHWTTGLEETLKNITMLAVGYWLGSSKGSTDKAELLAADGPSGNPGDPVAVTEEAKA